MESNQVALVRLRGGIDNGRKGAIVVIDESRDVVFSFLPKEVKDGQSIHDADSIAQALSTVRAMADRGHVFFALEKSYVMPAPGMRTSPKASFNYGRMYECYRQTLVLMRIPFVEVHPARWQHALGFPKKQEGEHQKARATAMAKKMVGKIDLMPGRRRIEHDGLADAACLALYAELVKHFDEDIVYEIPKYPSRKMEKKVRAKR